MRDQPVLRVARPTDQLPEIRRMYLDGLGFKVLGSFEDHDGFTGVMLGHPELPYHLEFTTKSGHKAGGAPSADHLLVFYYPDRTAWTERCHKMRKAGFREVKAFNPYWKNQGKTFEDPDGYRVVIQNDRWKSA